MTYLTPSQNYLPAVFHWLCRVFSGCQEKCFSRGIELPVDNDMIFAFNGINSGDQYVKDLLLSCFAELQSFAREPQHAPILDEVFSQNFFIFIHEVVVDFEKKVVSRKPEIQMWSVRKHELRALLLQYPAEYGLSCRQVILKPPGTHKKTCVRVGRHSGAAIDVGDRFGKHFVNDPDKFCLRIVVMPECVDEVKGGAAGDCEKDQG